MMTQGKEHRRLMEEFTELHYPMSDKEREKRGRKKIGSNNIPKKKKRKNRK